MLRKRRDSNDNFIEERKNAVLKDNDKAKDAELKNVLTADQYSAYQVKKDEIRKQMKKK
jgi:hypothetical protein